jgi:hypothetical protein
MHQLDLGERISVGERSIVLGKECSLPYAGEVGTHPREVASSIGLPAQCAQKMLSMGEPVQEMFGAASLDRFAALFTGDLQKELA